MFKVYNEAMKKLVKYRLAKEIQIEKRRRVKEEKKRLAFTNKFQSEFNDVRRHIVEKRLLWSIFVVDNFFLIILGGFL